MFSQLATIPLRAYLTTGLVGAAASPFAVPVVIGATVVITVSLLMLDKGFREGTVSGVKSAADWVAGNVASASEKAVGAFSSGKAA